MKRLLPCVLVLAAVVLWTAAAQAKLCPKCADRMFTADIGTCTACGGHTSSGAFKLCTKCSDAKGQCQLCLASLAGAKPPVEKAAEKRTEKPAEKPAAKGPGRSLTEADSGKTVQVKVGDVVTVSLKGNMTTGYSWRTAKLSGGIVQQMGEPKYTTDRHPRGMVGVGGVFVFKFKAAKSGKAEVKLEYVRPWEKDKEPAQTFTVTIEVAGK